MMILIPIAMLLLSAAASILTVRFRKKMDLAVWMALLALEGITAIGSGIFILTLGFFIR